ncbi:MAG: dolichyl-phosphate beta-glucosyltransferase [Candidatus Promineifilaceae bacterium]
MRPYLSVIIPAYNEEKRIGKTLESVYTYLQEQSFTWELLIVLDGVTDGTLDIVRDFAGDKKQIRWIDRRENRGKGYTIRQGMLAAKGEIRLFTDADNSTDMSHFDRMKPLFKNGAGVVICSRDGKDAEGAHQVIPQPFLKRVLGNLGNLFVQLMAVPGIWDTQCGFKAFRASAAEKIFSISRIDRWGFDMEALALARRFGYKIEVIGANWVDEPNTHVTRLDYIRSMTDALKVRWYLMTGSYNFSSAETAESHPAPVKEL